MSRPLIVIDAAPRGLDEIFDADMWARLKALGSVEAFPGPGRMPVSVSRACFPRWSC